MGMMGTLAVTRDPWHLVRTSRRGESRLVPKLWFQAHCPDRHFSAQSRGAVSLWRTHVESIVCVPPRLLTGFRSLAAPCPPRPIPLVIDLHVIVGSPSKSAGMKHHANRFVAAVKYEAMETRDALVEIYRFVRTHNWRATAKFLFQRKYWKWWILLAVVIALSAALSSKHELIATAIHPYTTVIARSAWAWCGPRLGRREDADGPLQGHPAHRPYRPCFPFRPRAGADPLHRSSPFPLSSAMSCFFCSAASSGAPPAASLLPAPAPSSARLAPTTRSRYAGCIATAPLAYGPSVAVHEKVARVCTPV
jgi:hypothetical protein